MDSAAHATNVCRKELWTLEAPVYPGLLAAPFGHRRDPGLLLECGGGGRACALFAEGDEQPGGEDGARSWQGLEEGEIGMALRALRAGSVTSAIACKVTRS